MEHPSSDSIDCLLQVALEFYDDFCSVIILELCRFSMQDIVELKFTGLRSLNMDSASLKGISLIGREPAVESFSCSCF